jgi:phytoene dehydrogenase-like protein
MPAEAVVIGSGPNGLAAALVLARAGIEVEVHEAAPVAGGGTRSGELTLPGFIHDLGSAVHPMALTSPFFSSLPLERYDLKWIWSPAALAHPLPDGSAIAIDRSLSRTSEQFSEDAKAYRDMFRPLVDKWSALASEVLRPLRVPRHPFLLSFFGIRAVQPASFLARSSFRNERTRTMFAGHAAHSVLKLESVLSSAFALIMGGSTHAVGWPIPQGGAQAISRALIRMLNSLGGQVIVNSKIVSLDQLGSRRIILCDVSPRQFLSIAGGRLRAPFRKLLEQYRYGPGIFKVDWALSSPIPWKAKDCQRAITVHLGASLDEIAESERDAWEGRPPTRPFVLLVQPTLFDHTRAPAGKHIAWAYCHVPNGYTGSALAAIENQIERYAPGFRTCVLATKVHGPAELQQWNENLIGGDIVGGPVTPKQFLLRPTWRRYRTPLKGVYLCSSATPPGGAVHGMCGYYAAQWALKDLKRARR